MSIRKEENGTYTVQIRIKDWTGKEIHKKKRGFKLKREAKEYEDHLKGKSGEINVTLKEFTDLYFADKENELKERSRVNKADELRKHILPFFGDRKITDITSRDIIQWQNYVSDPEKGYSDTYLYNLNKNFRAYFTHAEKVYNLKNNPFKNVKSIGKANAKKMNFWTYEEFSKFMEKIQPGTIHHVLFNTLYWTGIREGELLALTKEDIDVVNNQITINKTYYRKERRDIITPPKTEASNRIIEAPEFLIKELKEYMDRIYGLEDNDRIFPIVAETVQHKMKHIIEKAGVKKIRVHDLRHSHAAYLINKGVEMIVIKERFGHDDIRITINTYGHLYPNKHREVADMMDEEVRDKEGETYVKDE